MERDIRRGQRARARERGSTRSSGGFVPLFASLLAAVLWAGLTQAQTIELSPPGSPNVGPTLSCTEPTHDMGNVPLGTQLNGQDNSLLACWARVGPVEKWLLPTSPAGGGRHDLSDYLPDYVRSYPVDVVCVCLNRLGWGPARTARATVCLVETGI